MKPSWLIERISLDRGTDGLIDEIKKQGFEVQIASSSMEDYHESYLDLYPKESCVIFYGSLGFADQIRREATWVPGLYDDKYGYDCTHYYPALGDFLLAENYTMLPYGDLIRKKEYLYGLWGQDDTIFLRPNSGNKVFGGQTVRKEDFNREIPQISYTKIDPHELCVVSEPRNIEKEWRFVVVDHKVISGSQYIDGSRIIYTRGYTQEAFDLAQKVADTKYAPDRAWCIDICQTKAGNYYLLEIGCFSCAGLYACNREPIVREVSRVALEEWEEIYG